MANVRELEALVARYRSLLEEAEAALAAARARQPQVGDFVRSTLTSFYGRVTKVVPRASGRPWVEITPYLTAELPGSSTLDLFGDWEIIDHPSGVHDHSAQNPSFADIATQLAASLRAAERPGTPGP